MGDDFVLHETGAGFQQIKARFMEDGRQITHLHLQRWSTKTGNPIGDQIVLYGEQIYRLMDFLQNIQRIEIPSSEKFNVDESDLRLVRLTDVSALKILEDRPDLIIEFARNQITKEDFVALAYRRDQLSTFADMLERGDDFSERDWQAFFEKNHWIFGYGLSYIFTTGLDNKALQQTIRGSNFAAPGKIPDGIMKTRAAVSALCLVEIKRSSTELLKGTPYRPGTWAPSTELSGAVAQCQEAVRTAGDVLDIHQRITDQQGRPTGEDFMTVHPRSYLIIGSLEQFRTEHGINYARYRAFEGFRRNLREPEILTFDELYERASFIVDHAQNSVKSGKQSDDEFPF